MLYYNTISAPLRQMLLQLTAAPAFEHFRLVGGTALSLQLGHRMSVDLDFFSDVAYGIIDFGGIEDYLRKSFRYLDHLSDINPAWENLLWQALMQIMPLSWIFIIQIHLYNQPEW